MDPDAVAKAFVEHYYSTFDANRAGLANLYQDASMLTFEGQKIQGSQNIVAKLTSLPFQQCQHSITTVDCQPSGPAGGMLVFVSGNLQLAGEQHALKFSQMFHLMPTPQGSFYVLNDIFRLNYAWGVGWISQLRYKVCGINRCHMAREFDPVCLFPCNSGLSMKIGVFPIFGVDVFLYNCDDFI